MGESGDLPRRRSRRERSSAPLSGEGPRGLFQRERPQRIFPVHEDRQRTAERARIERGVGHAKQDRIRSCHGAILVELLRREFAAHRREGRSARRQRSRRETRAPEVELEPRTGMGRDE